MMRCLSQKYQPLVSAFICIIVLGEAIIVSIWITNPHLDAKVNKLNTLKAELECAICSLCVDNANLACPKDDRCEKIRSNCTFKGWHRPKNSKIVKECIGHPSTKTFIEKTTKYKLEHQLKDFMDHTEKDKLDYLTNALGMQQQTPNMKVHWFPSARDIKTNVSHWTKITEYERHKSIFTVSAGPDGSFDKGSVVLTESGLYLVYAKLTFACTDADYKQKRIHMEVVVQNTSDSNHRPMLSEVQHPTCRLRGNLVTLYQEGYFRLFAKNRVFLRYKAPENVRLSAGRVYVQSYFGIYRVGTALPNQKSNLAKQGDPL